MEVYKTLKFITQTPQRANIYVFIFYLNGFGLYLPVSSLFMYEPNGINGRVVVVSKYAKESM